MSSRRATLLASALFLLLGGSAVEQFATLQTTLRDARARNDWPASLRAATDLKTLLHDSPDALLEVARADVRVGDTAAAFRELAQYVRLGQSADLPRTAPEFAALVDRPAFADLERDMRANRTPITHASTAFVLPDTALLPEDVDYDPGAKRFYFTSVRQAKIVSADARGTLSEFARSPAR